MLDTDHADWMKVFNITPKLAGVVTVCRALVIWMAYRHRQHDICRWKDGEGMDELRLIKKPLLSWRACAR